MTRKFGYAALTCWALFTLAMLLERSPQQCAGLVILALVLSGVCFVRWTENAS